jgi:hypothetical protein
MAGGAGSALARDDGSAVVATAGETSGAAKASPGTLKLEASSFDFGDVFRGSQLVHRFPFVNAGTAPITIQGVHAACGCTAVEVDKGRKYMPGDTGYVEVKLDTSDFAGSLVKTVTIMSDEKLLPDRTLTLRAHVKTEIDVDPPLADFGDTPSKTGAAKAIVLKPLDGFKLDVKELVYNQQTLDAALTKQGDGSYLVTIKLKPGLPPGFLRETVIVRNNSSHLKELLVPVRATVKGNIDYAPTYLEFGAIPPSEAAKRAITMKGAGDFAITGSRTELNVNGRKVDDASKYIKVDAVPHDKDKRLVSVELRNAASLAGSVHGKLYLQTTDPDQKELTVDFYAFFR